MWGEKMSKTFKTPPDYSIYFKDSYPFNVGQRYIYFSSLAKTRSKIGQYTYKQASELINKGIGQITYNPKKENKMWQALQRLQQAADIEREKEIKVIEEFLNKFPEKVPESLRTIKKDDYLSIIQQINFLIKGIKPFQEQLKLEQERENEQRILENDQLQNKEQKYPKLKSLFKGELSGKKSLNNKTTDQMLNGIFDEDTNISMYQKIIIEKYGAKLFEFKQTLILNEGQMNALLRILGVKANELFMRKVSDYFTYGINKNKEEFLKQIENAITTDTELDDFFNNLMNSPNLNESLLSIAKQYGLDNTSGRIENIEKKIQIFKNRLFESYKKEHKNATIKDFDEWRQIIGADDDTISKMYTSVNNVSAQGYYQSENIAIAELITAGISATLGGNTNPTDDFLAGKLFFEFTTNSDLNNKLIQAEKEINKKRIEAYNKILTTTNKESYKTNIKTLKKLRTEQEQYIKTLQEEAKQVEENLELFLNQVNIHGTIKGYESSGKGYREEIGFQGASFGSNVFEQLSIIQETMGDIISIQDIQWLQFAMINAATQAIGANNKTSLEDYFSSMIGYLMFNDGQMLVEDAANQRGYIANGSNDIHLYMINSIYLPNSYILQKTYEALTQVASDIESKNNGIKARLHVYTGEPIDYTRNLTLEEWDASYDVAYNATYLDMHFLAGFLDILNNIAAQVSDALNLN